MVISRPLSLPLEKKKKIERKEICEVSGICAVCPRRRGRGPRRGGGFESGARPCPRLGPNPKVFCPRYFSSGGFGVSWEGSGRSRLRASRCPGFLSSGPNPALSGSSAGCEGSRVRPWTPGQSGTLRGPGSPEGPPVLHTATGTPGVPLFFAARGRASPPKNKSPSDPLDREFSACKYNLSNSAFLPRSFPCVYLKSYYL